LQGVVQTVEFLGQGTEISIHGALPQDLIARSESEWSQGDRIDVRLPADRLFVFPAEDVSV
nr:TOBE domain-containing protein [Chloroflexia bacterium]